MTHHELREALAALEHEQWAAWATDIAKTETITPARLSRWERLITTPYVNLTEPEKEQDREWADRVLDVLKVLAAQQRTRGENAMDPLIKALRRELKRVVRPDQLEPYIGGWLEDLHTWNGIEELRRARGPLIRLMPTGDPVLPPVVDLLYSRNMVVVANDVWPVDRAQVGACEFLLHTPTAKLFPGRYGLYWCDLCSAYTCNHFDGLNGWSIEGCERITHPFTSGTVWVQRRQ